MNLLEALVIVRNSSLRSEQMKTRRGQSALKVVDNKIQSLLRKKAWRDGNGSIPVHMGSESFLYPIPQAEAERDALRAQLDAACKDRLQVEEDQP